nr:prevent-host-death protein [Limosilactobacillus mucosae]
MEVLTPAAFKKDFLNQIKEIAQSNTPKEITLTKESGIDGGVVVIPKSVWEQIQEKQFLEETCTLDIIFDRMDKSSKKDFVEL